LQSQIFFHVKMGVGLAVRYCSALDTEASCIRKEGKAPPTERERERERERREDEDLMDTFSIWDM
jgi:GTP cyclohydrolase III